MSSVVETRRPGYLRRSGRASRAGTGVSPIKRVLVALDAAQRRHSVSAIAFGVFKKYGDDSAGNLASLLAFSGFVTLFPLLLLLVTVLGLVLSSDPHLRGDILRSTFAQFPLMGEELRSNVHALHRSSLIGLIVSVVLLFYGSFGLAGNGIYTMEQIWNLPGISRVRFLKRTGRSAEFIGLLGAGLVVSTFLSGLATNSASRPFWIDAGAIAISLVGLLRPVPPWLPRADTEARAHEEPAYRGGRRGCGVDGSAGTGHLPRRSPAEELGRLRGFRFCPGPVVLDLARHQARRLHLRAECGSQSQALAALFGPAAADRG